MPQSVLDSAGIQAGRIETLWWVMFWVTSIVAVVVLGFLAAAVLRARGRNPSTAGDPRLLRYVAGATVASV
jgi:hypothetical protein